ncbi:RNA methyltransferase [Bremerella cremea]|uniref:RNA methyltransferase n=1 Tax=Blastopirellula marina TaxID=124 RepID=A0A2S8G5Q7_9BACT|nr:MULTISPECIES: TfoX/Sxy family protein [Pirellulaceae]PQO39743.1 RNA methyltransferase [Blastopirellula marina]RCS51210.1 RNA methyltransferase [Bremerella cremea]
MTYNEVSSARVYRLLHRRKGFSGKQMFGGFGYLLNGNMCCGVWKDYLILRIGPDAYAEMLTKPHIKKFDITGKEMRGWVMVEPEGFVDDADLRRFVGQAVTFTKSLPTKVSTEAK